MRLSLLGDTSSRGAKIAFWALVAAGLYGAWRLGYYAATDTSWEL